MIIIRSVLILRQPYTCHKSKLNMAAAFILIQNRRQLRRERVFRDRNNPLDYMDDVDIIDKFRLPRFLILDLCGELRVHLEHLTGRSHAIPPSLQVMVALRFYASGNFQTVDGDVLV